MKRESSGSKRAPWSPVSADVRLAYHDGPPAIHFAGLPWQRGVAQTVTDEKYAEVMARGDVGEFDFREEPAAADAASPDQQTIKED